ncbi:MAG: sigma-54-dependent Fis family transcriptional regulator [Candidatus Puniceispirillum sp.]
MCADINSGKNQRNEVAENSIGKQSSITAISESWARCKDFGLLSSGKPVEAVISESQMNEILEENDYIRQLVTPELELLYNQIAGTNFMVAYANDTGVVLDSIQDEDFKAGEGGKAVIPGSVWMEHLRGTNALGLALHSGQPQIVSGQDHFFHKLGDLSCFACPIYDHEERIVGVIDATSDATARNHHTLALVKLASRNVENRLFVEQFSSSLILSFHARHEYLPTTSVALIAVDTYGFIEGANANAKAMLSGLDLSSRQHFGEVFSVNFSAIIDQLRANEVIQIRDVMGSVVFMTVQHSILKRALSAAASSPDIWFPNHAKTNAKPQTETAAQSTSSNAAINSKIYDDELFAHQIKIAGNTLKMGLPAYIEGDRGTGKTEFARHLHSRLFKDTPFIEVDCSLLTAENYTTQLFGDMDQLSFFEATDNSAKLGKLAHARGGTIFFDNITVLAPEIQQTILHIMAHEDTRRENADTPAIMAFLFAGKSLNDENDDHSGFNDEFIETIQGCQITIPSLAQRSDFEKIAHALMADISPQHTLSKVAINQLKAISWPGNIKQLRRALQLVVARSDETVIREDIQIVLASLGGASTAPCPKCSSSPVRMETCVMIKKTWAETGGNVSLVARRLGVSRNTVYKHLENSVA